ncbi:MAG: cell division protein [Sphingomonadales bacterium]|nr:cell division protein [Sphingomonadales bacterium]
MEEAKLLPLSGLSGPMPLVVAVMVALTVIATAGGLALRNVASAASAQLHGGLTVQIVEAAPAARDEQAEGSVAVLRALPGITAVRRVPRAELDALIEPWLGSGPDDAAGVPVPDLIDARLVGPVTPARLADIGSELHRVAPAARIDAQAGWLRPVFDAIATLQWLAAALVLLLAAVLAATVLLGARIALGSHRGTIEIVHMLGGTDPQVARIVQRAIGIDAAVGGAVGMGLASLVIVGLGSRFAGLDAGLVSGGALHFGDWLVLLLVPFAGVALAMLTARVSVLSSLRAML